MPEPRYVGIDAGGSTTICLVGDGASILARGTAAVQSALHAIRGGLDIPLAEGLAREAELFGQLCASADKKEAIQAFLEKRRSRLAGTEA